MFQDISQSVVLIAFVWGPLVNGGIRMGTVAYGQGKALVRTNFEHMGLCIDPHEQNQLIKRTSRV